MDLEERRELLKGFLALIEHHLAHVLLEERADTMSCIVLHEPLLDLATLGHRIGIYRSRRRSRSRRRRRTTSQRTAKVSIYLVELGKGDIDSLFGAPQRLPPSAYP